jgi:hypothetical protein
LAERAEREVRGYESDEVEALMKATNITITDKGGTRRPFRGPAE